MIHPVVRQFKRSPYRKVPAGAAVDYLLEHGVSLNYMPVRLVSKVCRKTQIRISYPITFCWNPVKRELAVLAHDKRGGDWHKIVIYDLERSEIVSSRTGRNLTSAVYSPDGKQILYGADGDAVIYDITTGDKKVISDTKTNRRIREVAWMSYSSDVSKNILAVTESGGLCMFDSVTGNLLRSLPSSLQPEPDAFRWACIDPSGRYIYQQSRSAETYIDVSTWSLKTASPLFFWSYSISTAGQIAAVRDNKIHVFDLGSTTEKFILKNDSDMRTVQFSPDGKLLVTGSNRRYQVWDLEARKRLLVFDGTFSFSSPCFSGDGKELAYGSSLIEVRDLSVLKANSY